MQNVVIAKPYEFVPPDRRRFWPAVFRPFLRPFLARVWGVTTIEIVGIQFLRAALRERASVSLAPNHFRPCDPTVVAVLGDQVGTPLYTMASWHQFMGRRWEAWLLRRLGAFSVYREGLDRIAVRTTVELMVEARRSSSFPRGSSHAPMTGSARLRRAGLHRPFRRQTTRQERAGSTHVALPGSVAVPLSGSAR
jgi:hypothetical protein